MDIVALLVVVAIVGFALRYLTRGNERRSDESVKSKVVSAARELSKSPLISKTTVTEFEHAQVLVRARWELRKFSQRVVAGSKVRRSDWNNGFTNRMVEVPIYKNVSETGGFWVLEARNNGASPARVIVSFSKWDARRKLTTSLHEYDFGDIGPDGTADAEFPALELDLTGARIQWLRVIRDGQDLIGHTKSEATGS